MSKKYPVVTLCGSTKFKEEFMVVQKRLTLQGFIVISVGLFGHSGDDEVWENKKSNSFTDTKSMLDDMHRYKIDLCDHIYVVNPGGYIGNSTWSEICYAKMIGKQLYSMVPITVGDINEKVQEHVRLAKKYAKEQAVAWEKQKDTIPSMDDFVTFKNGKEEVLDPWGSEDINPFEVYGRRKVARFIEEIVMKNMHDNNNKTN